MSSSSVEWKRKLVKWWAKYRELNYVKQYYITGDRHAQQEEKEGQCNSLQQTLDDYTCPVKVSII